MASHQRVRVFRDWSSLPPTTLSVIRKRLESGIDVFRCRSVCKKWRSCINPAVSLLSPVLPHKISNPTLPFNNRPNEDFLLVARTILLVEPRKYSQKSSGWILTVEEIVPGKLRILYPLSKDRVTSLPSNFPKCLNLSDFTVSEIEKCYSFKYTSDGENESSVQKVFLCSNSAALVLYGGGTLIKMRLKNGIWGFVRESLVTSFSDVINFNGMVCAVDCKGNLHTIDHNTMKVIKTVAIKFPGDHSKWNRKKLLATNTSEKPLLVGWPPKRTNDFSVELSFKAYYVDEPQNTWVETTLRGWVIFVSLDCCFIFSPRDLNISNHIPKIDENNPISIMYYDDDELYDSFCKWNINKEDYLVFSHDCFDTPDNVRFTCNRLLFEEASVNLLIGYIFNGTWDRMRHDYTRRTIAAALWPPPPWFLPDIFISSSDEENEQLDSRNQIASISRKVVLPPPCLAGRGSSSGAAINNEQGLITKTNGITMDSVAIGDNSNSPASGIQNFNTCASTTMFKGVKIKSNLVPTLQSIWSKQGNILEECGIRNGDLIAKALESLAMAVVILQSSSGRSLKKIQAEYLSSTLSDLKHMHFKLDWLTPFVEKALAVHKSKPLVDSLKKFSDAKTRAQEMKLKVLDELARLDEVEEDMKFIFEKIPVLESVDLDQSLGEGLC